MAGATTREFDVADHLNTPEEIAAYLNAVLENGDDKLLLVALRNVVKSKGFTQVASERQTETRLQKGPALQVNQNGGIGDQHVHKIQCPATSGATVGGSSTRRFSSRTDRSSNSAALASEIAPSASARNVRRSKRFGLSPFLAYGSS